MRHYETRAWLVLCPRVTQRVGRAVRRLAITEFARESLGGAGTRTQPERRLALDLSQIVGRQIHFSANPGRDGACGQRLGLD
jgi:hypothetical protein